MFGYAEVAEAGAPVFVAPHPDDVALSCGGTVAMQARTESPRIVTIFSGQPTGEMSEFARGQHERWGVEPDVVAKQRRSEDACAAAALGDAVQAIWLDRLDAIYREPSYNSDEALFGKLVAADLDRIDDIVADLESLHASAYIVPLAVGNHVDHQLAFRAGRRLAARGAAVWAYADVPYVLDLRRLTPRLAMGTVREARVTYLDDDAFERKVRAIECYTSQLPVIFRDYGDIRTALDTYARHVGGGARAEVCWRVLPGRR
jgi:LmbE family N-acetylglucosaminyl deacetylase